MELPVKIRQRYLFAEHAGLALMADHIAMLWPQPIALPDADADHADFFRSKFATDHDPELFRCGLRWRLASSADHVAQRIGLEIANVTKGSIGGNVIGCGAFLQCRCAATDRCWCGHCRCRQGSRQRRDQTVCVEPKSSTPMIMQASGVLVAPAKTATKPKCREKRSTGAAENRQWRCRVRRR